MKIHWIPKPSHTSGCVVWTGYVETPKGLAAVAQVCGILAIDPPWPWYKPAYTWSLIVPGGYPYEAVNSLDEAMTYARWALMWKQPDFDPANPCGRGPASLPDLHIVNIPRRS